MMILSLSHRSQSSLKASSPRGEIFVLATLPITLQKNIEKSMRKRWTQFTFRYVCLFWPLLCRCYWQEAQDAASCILVEDLKLDGSKSNSWSLFSDLSWKYPSLAIFFCSSEIQFCPFWDKSSLGPVRTISLWPADRIGIQLEFPSPACNPCYTCILLRLLCLFRTTIIQ
jgi:hypothetical protein